VVAIDVSDLLLHNHHHHHHAIPHHPIQIVMEIVIVYRKISFSAQRAIDEDCNYYSHMI